jgi:hypothetical protein
MRSSPATEPPPHCYTGSSVSRLLRGLCVSDPRVALEYCQFSRWDNHSYVTVHTNTKEVLTMSTNSTATMTQTQ